MANGGVAIMSEPKKDLRDDVSVKMDRQTVQLAKAAAALDNKSLAEWLSDTVFPIAVKRLNKPTVRPLDSD